jgi:hypothetical protein
MNAFLIVFDVKENESEYRQFLQEILSKSKHSGEDVQLLSKTSYMVKANRFLQFISLITMVSKEMKRINEPICCYRCLAFSEEPQWMCSGDLS